MHGNDVEDMQRWLTRKAYLHDKIDGQYGPKTAQAAYRAKYWLGYRKPDHAAGPLLLAYLRGKKPPAAMRIRAAARRRKDVKKHIKATTKGVFSHAELIIKQALTQLGQTEHPPNSNRSKFSVWYGIIGAWCAMFVTWVFVTLGYSKRTFQRARHYAYVPYIVADAIRGVNGLMLASQPEDAILACYDWLPKDGVADHVGICAEEATLKRLAYRVWEQAVRDYGPLGKGDFWAIEGNTGIGNDSNGGMTMIRKRNRANVQHFVKVAA